MSRTKLFVVDDTASPCRFSNSIQDAVNAARDGDVVLVKSGVYSSRFLIDGKSLCVIGEGGPQMSGIVIEVKNVPAGKNVVLRGFQNSSFAAFLENNSGPIWVEDCSWTTRNTRSSYLSTVGLFRCRISGGRFGAFGAFSAESSVVFSYHSSFQGLDGIYNNYEEASCEHSGGIECYWTDGTDGELGFSLASSGSAFLFGCSLVGGIGSPELWPFCDCISWPDHLPATCGGNALRLPSSTSATVLQTQLVSGSPDCDLTAVTGSGTLTTMPGQTGEFSVNSPVLAGAPLHFRFTGPPGWRAFFTYGFEYVSVFDPLFHGMSVVPLDSPTIFVGTLPASGTLETDVSYGNLLQPGAEARLIYLQAKFYDLSTCRGVLGTPSALVVVRDPCP